MKRFIAILLVALMCVSALSLVACGGSKGTKAPEKNSPTTSGSKDPGSAPETSEGKTTPSVETDDDGDTPNDIFTSVNYTPNKLEEHQVQSSLPESHTLVGTDYLPKLVDQGKVINSSASEAITYLQFTNAVAQYAAKNSGSTWKPATDSSSCFSSKYTYQFVGNSHSGVYAFLRDHGTLTKAEDDFTRDSKGRAIVFKNTVDLQTQTTRWILDKGVGEQAMAYRLASYEQCWVTNVDYGYDSVKSRVHFTTSDEGKELLNKVKDALVCGNVVVTGGNVDETWQTTKLSADSGSAKKGDLVVTHASFTKNQSPKNYQVVAIVGYDDTIECKVPGTTEDEVMKGAFLIQGSFGDSWNNKGYVWLFYDAVNTVSEFETFTIPETETKRNAVDQFSFIYWDRDITTKKPGMYAELEIETTDRDALYVELGRTDAYGRYVGATPYMFVYTHPVYTNKTETGLSSEDDFYLNTKGEVNGGTTTAYYTVSFERLLSGMMDGTTEKNYQWSIKVRSNGKADNAADTVTLKSIVIKNANGETLHSATFDPEAEKVTKGTNTYVFRLGNETISKGTLAGDYIFQNVATGSYLAADGTIALKTSDAEKDALKIRVQYLSEDQAYFLWRIEKVATKTPTMTVDVNPDEVITSGASLRFNKQSINREITQQWKLSHNSDGTFTFYITTENGTNYALALADGKLCLKKATELTDDIKWNCTLKANNGTAVSPTVTSAVSSTAEGLNVTASVGKVASVKIVVSDMTGKVVAESTATAQNSQVTATVKVDGAEKGATYLVKVLNADDGTAAASFTFITIA